MHKPLYGNQELLKLNQGYVIQITSKIECSTPHTIVFFSINYNTTVLHKILMDTDSSNIWQMVTGFPYAPVAFKIFDGLNLTG